MGLSYAFHAYSDYDGLHTTFHAYFELVLTKTKRLIHYYLLKMTFCSFYSVIFRASEFFFVDCITQNFLLFIFLDT